MYGLYNDCDAYIVCEFRSLARNEDNSLTYRTIAMSSIEEDINRCMTSANLTTGIIDSKICNEVLMDKCNFVLSSGNDNESYEAMNYQTYEDIPQSLRANYEADSYNRLLKDTSIADNNYYLFYMASGGGASVPDNGVTNLSHRLYNISVGQYEDKNILVYTYEISYETDLTTGIQHVYVGYTYRCYDETGVPDISNPISSDINAYSLPKTYDAYFDMFLSQYNTTGLIDNMQ